MEKHSNYSVLMSVYNKEKAQYLKEAMNSIWEQSIVPDEFVLVCDGPLSDELNFVVDEMRRNHSELVVVRLEKNKGLGNALNEGMKHCKNELIARMDSDDISRKDRCEKQLEVFDTRPEISIVSGTVEEFVGLRENIETKRVLPENNSDIVEFAKKRNPYNHPCVMYKKSAVEAAGGYQDFYLLEDYYLWVRMIQNDCIGYNIQQPLLWMRAGSDMYKRRSGVRYAKSQRALFLYMKEHGFISWGQYSKAVVVRSVSSVMPNKIREILFKRLMRTKKQ